MLDCVFVMIVGGGGDVTTVFRELLIYFSVFKQFYHSVVFNTTPKHNVR